MGERIGPFNISATFPISAVKVKIPWYMFSQSFARDKKILQAFKGNKRVASAGCESPNYIQNLLSMKAQDLL